MIDYTMGLIAKLAGFDLGIIIVFLAAFNMIVSSLASALDMIKDKTKTDLDNKAALAVHKIADKLSKILDFLGGNRKHK